MTPPELLDRGIIRLPIDAIKIENRRREEFGDLAGLAQSISRHGLLHPLVVDDDGRLIAGERRLRACRSLGFLEVDVRRWGALSDAERDEIELEENIRRKDLTQHERSKEIVRLAEKAAEVDRKGFRAESARNPSGRPEKAGSLRRVAERTGIPAKTIHDAKQHVAAVDHYPELAPMPQRDAVKIASKLDAMPEPERVEKRAAVMRQEAAVLAELTDRPPLPSGPTPHQLAVNDPGHRFHKGMHDVWVRLNSIRDHGGIEAVVASWSVENRGALLEEVDRMLELLREWRDTLEGLVDAA